LHFGVFRGLPHEGHIQLDDAGGKPVYLSSSCQKRM
jgi:hypothetical protein